MQSMFNSHVHTHRWSPFGWHTNRYSHHHLHATLHHLQHCCSLWNSICGYLPIVQFHLQKQKVKMTSVHVLRVLVFNTVHNYIVCMV